MKSTRALLCLIAASVATVALQAQINFVFLEKGVNYVQTSESTPTLDGSTPHYFLFGVDGSSGLTPVRINTTASGSSVTGTINASYTDNWETPAANFANQAALDAAYANGVYNVTVGATTTNMTLGNGSGPFTDNYPSAAPMVTGLSASDFDGSGRLKINTSLSSYTFNLSALAGYTSGGHIGVVFEGVDDGDPVEAESIYFSPNFTDPAVSFLTFNPSASNMVAGNTYTLSLDYNLFSDAAVDRFGGGDFSIGLFTFRTELTIIAIPEPSTYAAMAGLLALTSVIISRRRRTV